MQLKNTYKSTRFPLHTVPNSFRDWFSGGESSWNCVYQSSERFQFIMGKGSLFQKISKSQSKILPALAIIPSGRLLLQAPLPWLQIIPPALPGHCDFSAPLTFGTQLLARETGIRQFSSPKGFRTCYLVPSVVVFCATQGLSALVWRSASVCCSPGHSTSVSSHSSVGSTWCSLCHEHEDAATSKHSAMSPGCCLQGEESIGTLQKGILGSYLDIWWVAPSCLSEQSPSSQELYEQE